MFVVVNNDNHTDDSYPWVSSRVLEKFEEDNKIESRNFCQPISTF